MSDMTEPQNSLPLSGVRVLDLTRVRAGPTAVRQLADWGADVIKIEMPEGLEGGDTLGGPRHGSDFQNLQRNKRGMTLNLKHPRGMVVFKRMVAGTGRHADCRPHGRHFLLAGHSAGVDRAAALGHRTMGADLAFAGADIHARLPGGALANRGRGAATGGQRSSDLDPDRSVQDP